VFYINILDFIFLGCDVNIPNKQLQQPLYTACEKGNEKVVQYLLDTRKCKIDGLIPSAIPLFVKSGILIT
jgi:ankyrin repeat protein